MFLSLPRFHDIWGDRKVNLIWTANCLGPSTAVGLFQKCPVKPSPVLYLKGQLVPVIARALPGDVTDAAALVAGLGPSVGAVLHNMAHLVAIVAVGSTPPVAEVATTAAKSARFWRTVRTSVSV